ncbi:MAG TPA: heme-binding protein, partial [Methyloceanibacter sp.]|nr:heme-binding protein [Methyloceanibacter sp.]
MVLGTYRKGLQLATGLLVVAACGSANSASLVTSQKLPWATAEKLAAEAVRICEERGYSVAAAAVDPSGLQQVVIRGDAAPVHTLSVAYRKAYTA